MTMTDYNVIEQLRARREGLLAQARSLLDTAALEQRQLTEPEDVEHSSTIEAIEAIDARMAELADEEARCARAAAAQRGSSRISVGREAGIYRPDGEASYFGDLARRQLHGDSGAAERLARHSQAVALEHRDLTRTDGAGGEFVPPAHLTALYAGKARPGRVTADRLTRIPLPAGTDSINIPRITTGTATAIQTADNAAVQETDLVDANASAPVRTIAGQQDVAIQVLEQSSVAFDTVIFRDLMADFDQRLDLQVLSGSGASGQVTGLRTVAGISAVTYTDATPTLPELLGKLADGYQTMGTTRFLPPTEIVMHPRRWAWAMKELDTTNRPLIEATAGAGFNVIGRGDTSAAEGQVGTLLGLPVFVDANIPTNLGAGTNEDVILMLRAEDHLLFESGIRSRVLPDVGSGTLTVRLQVYGYVALAAGRYPASTVTVGGTGTVAPTF